MSTTLNPGRRAALAIGVPLIAASVAWTGVGLASLSGRTTTTSTASYDVPGKHVSITATAGSVALRASADDLVHVTTTLRYGLHEPTVDTTMTESGLRIEGKCRWYEEYCSVNLDVAVPVGFATEVTVSGGHVGAVGLAGDTRISSSGGDIHVSAMAGNLVLDSGGGNVLAAQLTSRRVLAYSSGGNIQLRFSSAPVEVEARSSGGDVQVHVPPGEKYRIAASSSGGDVNVTVPRDDLSTRSLTAQSSGGDVSIDPDGDLG